MSEPGAAPPLREIDCVVLLRDLPEASLRAGEAGTVVFVLSADEVIVEFVEPTGQMRARETFSVRDLRRLTADELRTKAEES